MGRPTVIWDPRTESNLSKAFTWGALVAFTLLTAMMRNPALQIHQGRWGLEGHQGPIQLQGDTHENTWYRAFTTTSLYRDEDDSTVRELDPEYHGWATSRLQDGRWVSANVISGGTGSLFDINVVIMEDSCCGN